MPANQHARQLRQRMTDAWLQAQGYRVLRFWNNDILQHPDTVLAAIWQALPEQTRKDASA